MKVFFDKVINVMYPKNGLPHSAFLKIHAFIDVEKKSKLNEFLNNMNQKYLVPDSIISCDKYDMSYLLFNSEQKTINLYGFEFDDDVDIAEIVNLYILFEFRHSISNIAISTNDRKFKYYEQNSFIS